MFCWGGRGDNLSIYLAISQRFAGTLIALDVGMCEPIYSGMKKTATELYPA